jgi:hypothetical protein
MQRALAAQGHRREMFVVPKAEHEVKMLPIEPRGVLNTGHEGGERTARNDVCI